MVGLTADGRGRIGIATTKAIEVIDPLAETRRTGLETKLPVVVRFGLE